MEANKKPLPWEPTKSQVHRIYLKQNRKLLLAEIYAAMELYRKKSFDEIKNVRTLLHPEWAKIVRFFGVPNGYYAPEGFFDGIE